MKILEGYWQIQHWGKTHDQWIDIQTKWMPLVVMRLSKVLTDGNKNLQDDYEDIVQEAWLKIMRGWNTCRTSLQAAWISTVASRAALDYVRKFNNRSIQFCSYDAPEFNQDHLLAQRTDSQVWQSELWEQMQTLPERQSEALVLTAEGYKGPEIAVRLSCTPEQARQYVHRGRKAMRALRSAKAGRRMPGHSAFDAR